MTFPVFFNFFLISSAFCGFVFSIVLFFFKNGRDKSMLYLNLLVLVISFNNLQSWLFIQNFFLSTVSYIQIPWHFLIAPFFYMFLVHYLGISRKTLKIKYAISLFFMVAIFSQIGFVLMYQNILELNKLEVIFEKYRSIEEIISFVVSIGVFLYSFYILTNKEKLYLKILSFDKLQWVYTFFKIGAICYVLWILALIIKLKMNFSGFLFSYYPLRIATTLLIFWIAYQAKIQLQILKERRALRAVLVIEEKEVIYRKREEVSLEFDAIENYIFLHKKFTDAQLSRDLLAEEMNINKNKLSSIINKVTQKTYIEYMNDLRVDFSKHLLTNKKYQKYTITAIGLESGFNSKSSFYYVFKKCTGKTPLQFKEENS